MPAYAVAYIKSVTDSDKFAAYREVAGPALAKHGGRVAVATPTPVRLEGDMQSPAIMVLLEFPSTDAVSAWHGDPELADAHELRRGGVDISIFIAGQVD